METEIGTVKARCSHLQSYTTTLWSSHAAMLLCCSAFIRLCCPTVILSPLHEKHAMPYENPSSPPSHRRRYPNSIGKHRNSEPGEIGWSLLKPSQGKACGHTMIPLG